jgi:hypothetical protein
MHPIDPAKGDMIQGLVFVDQIKEETAAAPFHADRESQHRNVGYRLWLRPGESDQRSHRMVPCSRFTQVLDRPERVAVRKKWPSARWGLAGCSRAREPQRGRLCTST